jgi:hypothetical protein
MENPANSQAALGQIQQAQATAQNPNDILAGQRQQLGVGAAQDTVTGLRGAINNTTKLLKQVAPSVMGRTQNSLVTNAQATRQIGNEQAPLAENLTDQGQQYNMANEDLGRLEGQASQAANGIYQGQQDKLSYLQNIYNTLYGKEQDASKQAEATRQFNAEQSRLKSASSGSGVDYGSIIASMMGGGGTAPTAPGAKKFIGNDDYRGRLAFDAKQGDPDAKVALKYAGNDGMFNGRVTNKAEYDVLKRLGIQGNYDYLRIGNKALL